MHATRSATIILLVTTSLAIGVPTQAAQAPATVEPGNGPIFTQYLQGCCKTCTESAEKLCGSGHVKNFDCGGWPCECSFDCDNNFLIPEALALEV